MIECTLQMMPDSRAFGVLWITVPDRSGTAWLLSVDSITNTPGTESLAIVRSVWWPDAGGHQ